MRSGDVVVIRGPEGADLIYSLDANYDKGKLILVLNEMRDVGIKVSLVTTARGGLKAFQKMAKMRLGTLTFSDFLPKSVPARLDADKTCKPMTRIIHHPEQERCIGPGTPLRNPELENLETGVHTLLVVPADDAGSTSQATADHLREIEAISAATLRGVVGEIEKVIQDMKDLSASLMRMTR